MPAEVVLSQPGPREVAIVLDAHNQAIRTWSVKGQYAVFRASLLPLHECSSGG